MFFDVFMDVCLYDPNEGFFSAGKVRAGKAGDFLTSPEVSSRFGSLVGAWALNHKPSAEAVLIEVGAGSGALLEGLAPFWLDHGLTVYALEVSTEARRAIEAELSEVMVVASFDDLPRGTDAVVIANEVLDNLPAALAKRVSGGWVEIAVDVRDGDLTLVDVEARPEVSDWCDDVFGVVSEGLVVAVQLAAGRFVEGLLQRFRHVALCLIDYGATAVELATRDVGSIVRTHRNHQSGQDWLELPGATDITVDVNMTAIDRIVTKSDARVAVTTQHEFLIRQGAAELIDDAIDMERLNARNGDVMQQLVARSDRVALEALLDPRGLGGFKVVVIESGTQQTP